MGPEYGFYQFKKVCQSLDPFLSLVNLLEARSDLGHPCVHIPGRALLFMCPGTLTMDLFPRTWLDNYVQPRAGQPINQHSSFPSALIFFPSHLTSTSYFLQK